MKTFVRFFFLLFFFLSLIQPPPAFSDETGWKEILFQGEKSSRFVSGIHHQGKIIAGTHSPAAVYTFSLRPFGEGLIRTFFPDPQNPAEAVLDLFVFQKGLYAVVEKTPAELRKWNPESGVWEIHYMSPGVELFFIERFLGRLYFTGRVTDGITLFQSDNGRHLQKIAHLADWAWVPVVFQDRLYLLGHRGSAYHRGEAAAYASPDGRIFAPVAELAGGYEYQAAYAWKGHLYLGTGGWTTDRKAGDQARIYRYDGQTRVEVLKDIGMNGITSFGACGRHLYALADSGWERDQGFSALYRTVNGSDWKQIRTFPHPEMRRIVVIEDEILLVLGGMNRNYGVALINDTICREEASEKFAPHVGSPPTP